MHLSAEQSKYVCNTHLHHNTRNLYVYTNTNVYRKCVVARPDFISMKYRRRLLKRRVETSKTLNVLKTNKVTFVCGRNNQRYNNRDVVKYGVHCCTLCQTRKMLYFDYKLALFNYHLYQQQRQQQQPQPGIHRTTLVLVESTIHFVRL